ncbi:MAG: hemolysin family protein [Proteobacteria bacterium]|nr:hemolysin family protein [Pseudomonadota bacterium]MBU4259618.1 hemolysin family protein [Pseudomonadota bacterium]MBU4288874.1 hemolysin family protein [Pseudomonadota bacterium]MBU4414153.1 hemolysin family protein [Pseudomonadota bacterium]MCG2758570.1 hemolysin family protein [Desulfobacteraceae bacterium]
MISINIIIIVLCILIQGFFSGSEMVLISSNKLRLRRKVAKGYRGAKLALDMINNQRWYLATTSTGTNMFVIIASVVAAALFEGFFENHGEILTIVIISPFLLMFGEIIPRTIFQQNATRIAPKISHLLFFASRIISPITYLIFWASERCYGRIGKENIKRLPFITKEELSMSLSIPGEESDLRRKEKKLIHRVFHLSESKVSDVMVPLVNVTAITNTADVSDATKILSRTGYSRLPVFKDRIDNLIGIIYFFDLLHAHDNKAKIEQFIRKTPIVPELKRVDDLLLSFQKSHNSIAIVVDEYGGSAGIITIEDILEEVVGDIRDEYDREISKIIKLNDNKFLINARMEIEDVNEQLKINLPKEDYETIGGFLLKHMGEIPQKGDKFIYKNIKFTIMLSSKRSIHEIVVDIEN